MSDLIWSKAQKYLDSLKQNNITHTEIILEFSNSDFNYLALCFNIIKDGITVPIKIDRFGIKQKWNIFFFSFYTTIANF